MQIEKNKQKSNKTHTHIHTPKVKKDKMPRKMILSLFWVSNLLLNMETTLKGG